MQLLKNQLTVICVRLLPCLGVAVLCLFFPFRVAAQDTLVMPLTGNGGVYNTCDALIFDHGLDSNYPNFSHATLTIAPLWTQSVYLYFEEFNTEIHFDSLNIFDGPAITFPLIGTYSGTGLQGQTIASTGNAITLEFRSDDIQTGSGFKIRVTCLLGNEELENTHLQLFPNPAQSYVELTGITAPEIKNLYLLDAQGRLILSCIYQGRVDLTQLTPGLYTVCIELVNGGRVFKKLWKV
jgi:hypothetical protein